MRLNLKIERGGRTKMAGIPTKRVRLKVALLRQRASLCTLLRVQNQEKNKAVANHFISVLVYSIYIYYIHNIFYFNNDEMYIE